MNSRYVDRWSWASRFAISPGGAWRLDLDDTYFATAANNTIHNIGLEDIGMAAAICPNSGGGAFQVIANKSQTGTLRWLLTLSSGKLRTQLQDGTDLYTVTGNTDLRDGVWHRVAAIIDRDNAANCKIYLNGAEDGATVKSGSLADIDSLSNTGTFALGRDTGGSPLDGKMAEFIISYPADIMAANEMGAAGEIANIANNFRDPTAWPNNEDYWLLDEGTGTTLTGDNNNLTLSNAAAWEFGDLP